MKKYHTYFYWDRIGKMIGLPILFIAFIILCAVFLPKRISEDIEKYKLEKVQQEEQKKAQEEKINYQKFKEQKRQEEKQRQEESRQAEITNVKKSTLTYETKIAKKRFPVGTYVYDSEFGSGQVLRVSGFEISTKEGWNFNVIDVDNGDREIKHLSYKEYKKALKRQSMYRKTGKSHTKKYAKQYRHEYYLKHKEELKKKNKKNVLKYYKGHRLEILEKIKKWKNKKKNKLKMKDYRHEYYLKHKLEWQEKYGAYKVKTKNGKSSNYKKEMIKKFYELQKRFDENNKNQLRTN